MIICTANRNSRRQGYGKYFIVKNKKEANSWRRYLRKLKADGLARTVRRRQIAQLIESGLWKSGSSYRFIVQIIETKNHKGEVTDRFVNKEEEEHSWPIEPQVITFKYLDGSNIIVRNIYAKENR